MRSKLVAALVGAVLLLLGAASPAEAHEANTTAIEVSATSSGLDVQVDLPIDELSAALGEEVPTDTFGLSQSREPIVAYITDHLSFADAEAGDWPLAIGQIRVISSDRRDYLRAAVAIDGTTASDEFTITSDAIIEHDDSHKVIVTVVADDGTARIAGFIDSATEELGVALNDDGSASDSSFTATVRYGFDHVLDGADHLLFLLTLLLPAPLIATAGRWSSAPGFRRGMKRVLHVATAFMIGHSISLAASAFDVVSLPSRPIEIAIAFSVAVSALHAMRPIAARGEIVIAVGFGLIHGLAFAEILDGFGLEGSNTLVTLLAFNLGVEVAQLVTIAVTFPSLWVLSRTTVYPVARCAGAVFALVLASGWTADRIGIMPSPLSSIEEAAIDNLGAIAAALAMFAGLAWLFARRDDDEIEKEIADMHEPIRKPIRTVGHEQHHRLEDDFIRHVHLDLDQAGRDRRRCAGRRRVRRHLLLRQGSERLTRRARHRRPLRCAGNHGRRPRKHRHD